MAPTRIWTDVDYDKPGKQIGWLNLHHSVTRSAYGNIIDSDRSGEQRQRPDGLVHGGQPWRRIRRPDRALQADPHVGGGRGCWSSTQSTAT
jgi:hypothetical protein